MLYEKQSFTLPTTNRKMTDEEYEIAVGIRCAKCKKPAHVPYFGNGCVHDPAGMYDVCPICGKVNG